jgi:NADH-quinone oxidoreductase subunit A
LNVGADLSHSLWPMGVFFICAITLVGLMIGVSFLLGQRHAGRVTAEPYESGMPVSAIAGLRLNVKYYLIAILFVIFDVEAVFIYVWALSARELGWSSYVVIVTFIGVLLAALFYLSRLGAFNWGKSGERDRTKRGGS